MVTADFCDSCGATGPLVSVGTIAGLQVFFCPRCADSGPDFKALAEQQATEAVQRGRVDFANAPQFTWGDLHQLVGPMLPGDFPVIGGMTGNGKTAFLMSQMNAFAQQKISTLYLPLEIDPATMRRRWAAWQLGFDPLCIARNDWKHLPEGAQEAHEAMIAEQAKSPYVHFPPDKRISLDRLKYWVEHGVKGVGAKIVMIDHFHRLEFGNVAQYRIQVTETVRAIKDLARTHEIVILASAQLNQPENNPLDRYHPPQLRRLKESAGIGEEADLVLMLSRRLKGVMGKQDFALVKAGLKSEREYAEPNVMAVTCRKHRLADAIAGDRTILLTVNNGKCESHYRWGNQP